MTLGHLPSTPAGRSSGRLQKRTHELQESWRNHGGKNRDCVTEAFGTNNEYNSVVELKNNFSV